MIQQNVSLQPFNTFGVEARAASFAQIDSEAALLRVLEEKPGCPTFVLGGGSNLLLTRDLQQLVLRNAITGKSIVRTSDDHALVRAGGGENWHEFVAWSLKQGLGGLENLSLIPGTVGAAPIQNIGAYGVELAQVFNHLEAVELASGSMRRFGAADCRFGYRDSVFKNELKGQYFITQVYLRLTKPPHHRIETSYGALKDSLRAQGITDPQPEEVSQAVIQIRQSKLPDPSAIGNSGSFFKNPELPDEAFEDLKRRYPEAPGYAMGNGKTKVPAGWLIEKAGWKGKRVGQAGTYHKQALVLVNHGGASGSELWALAQRIAGAVEAQFGIRLQPEVNVI